MINLKQKQKEAADFLGKKGRRIEIIFYGILLTFVTIFPILIFFYAEYLIGLLLGAIMNIEKLSASLKSVVELVPSIISGVIVALLAIFITLPVFSCFFRHSYKIYREGIAGEKKYFDLGSHGYFGAIKSGFIAFGVFALCLAPVITFVEIGMHYYSSQDKQIANLINYLFIVIVALGLVLGFFIFLLFRPLFLFGYYIARGKNTSVALKKSIEQMRSQRAKTIFMAYMKSFIPSLLLSLATVLVFFLLDTLPKMSIVYFDIADEIIYGEQQ